MVEVDILHIVTWLYCYIKCDPQEYFMSICGLGFTARKESAKEKQLKEEEKILESVAEGRGTAISFKILHQFR